MYLCTGAYYFIMRLRASHLYCCKYIIFIPPPFVRQHTRHLSESVGTEKLRKLHEEQQRYKIYEPALISGDSKKKKRDALRQENSQQKYEAFFLSKHELGALKHSRQYCVII